MAWETVFIFWNNPLNIVTTSQKYRTILFFIKTIHSRLYEQLHVLCNLDDLPGSIILLKATAYDAGFRSTKINHVCSKNVNTVSNSCEVLSLFHPLSFILLTPDRWQDVSLLVFDLREHSTSIYAAMTTLLFSHFTLESKVYSGK